MSRKSDPKRTMEGGGTLSGRAPIKHAPVAMLPIAPVAVEGPRLASARVARLIVHSNGAGLSRDSEIVERVFRKSGWEVQRVDPKKMRGSLTYAAVNVHFEIVAANALNAAAKNIIIPNPEWWQPEWSPLLAQPSVTVWAKSASADKVFEGLGGRVVRTGFCSVDRMDATVKRERAFLHVSGASPNKGTAALIGRWCANWPTLTVVSSFKYDSKPNVCVMSRVPDEELRALQNRHAFHIYPSKYEGFGHAQWEGLSCGAVVFVTDGPPFDEHEGFRLIPSVAGGLCWNRLVEMREATDEGLASAVAWSRSVPETELSVACEKARACWEASVRDFESRAADALPHDGERPASVLGIVAGALSSVLADAPPMAYVGRVNCVTGYGAAARHQLHVLRRHGGRFAIVDAGSVCDPDPQRQDRFVQAARKSDVDVSAAKGTIVHLAPNMATKWRHLPRPHILVSVWETTRLPVDWVRVVDSFDQVWCATEWQRQVYKDSGVDERRLRVVPFAVDPELYRVVARPRVPATVFGSVFQWTERKAPGVLIGAYLQAFTAADPVTLILKSYEGDSPSTSVENHVHSIVKSFHLRHAPPAIKVVSKPMTSGDMMAFYQSIDCYVSAHRGEGFGLPIAEALLSGRPVIATNWSAPAEYAEGLFRPVKFAMQPPHGMSWQPFYSIDQSWAHPDTADLAQAMRQAHARQLTCPRDLVLDRFSSLMERAGQAAASALKGLA